MSKEEEWLAGGHPILMFEREVGWPSRRKQRLFAVACCRSVHNLFPEEAVWVGGLNLAERVADRKATYADLANFVAKQEQRIKSMNRSNLTYRDIQENRIQVAVRSICTNRERNYASQVASSTAGVFAYGLFPLDSPVNFGETNEGQSLRGAIKLEEQRQLHLLRDICGDDFRPVQTRIAKLSPQTLGIARSAYEERRLPTGHIDNDTLAVLSDALEEANLANAKMLAHLRSSGPHVRGCWALDLLLGKK